MKITMSAQISGTRDGKDWPAPGETLDVSADEGKALCEQGMAEPVDSRSAKTETATKPQASTKRGLTTKNA